MYKSRISFLIVIIVISIIIPIACFNNKEIQNQGYKEVQKIADNKLDEENKLDNDVSDNVKNDKKNKCVVKIGDLCFATKAFVPRGVPCNQYQSELNIEHCAFNGTKLYSDKLIESGKDVSDKWVDAILICKNAGGHLPDETEMNKLASAIYKKTITTPQGSSEEVFSNYKTVVRNGEKWLVLAHREDDDSIADALGIKRGGYYSDGVLYSSFALYSYSKDQKGYYRNFGSISTKWYKNRGLYGIQAVCIAD